MNTNKYKVIVAHPEKQHSLQLAVGLKKTGLLYKYITTIYDRPQSLTNKIKMLLPEKYKAKANTRSIKGLEYDDVLQFRELSNLLITFIYNIFHLKKLCILLRLRNADAFGIKVAKYAIKKKVDAVVCYDTRAYKTFKYLEKNAPNIVRILDTTIVTAPYMRKIYDEQIKQRGVTELKSESPKLWDNKYLKRVKKEIQLSNYCLAASGIVCDSLEYCGTEKNKILKVPYGVDISRYFPVMERSIDDTLKLIIVGGGYRKGLDLLFAAVSEYSEKQVTLEVVGNYVAIEELIKPYNNCKNISYVGFLTADKLIKRYQEADVFILPSLCEGMALVGLEAMACGLPLICSENTGVNDLIVNYKNGIVIPIGDMGAIKKAIDFCILNREKVREMGICARKTAEKYTWEHYQSSVSKEIERALNNCKIR